MREEIVDSVTDKELYELMISGNAETPDRFSYFSSIELMANESYAKSAIESHRRHQLFNTNKFPIMETFVMNSVYLTPTVHSRADGEGVFTLSNFNFATMNKKQKLLAQYGITNGSLLDKEMLASEFLSQDNKPANVEYFYRNIGMFDTFVEAQLLSASKDKERQKHGVAKMAELRELLFIFETAQLPDEKRTAENIQEA